MPPRKYVNCDAIRQLFTEGHYFEDWQSGRYRTTRIKDSGPPQTHGDERFPPGYRSQMVRISRSERPDLAIAWFHERAGDEYGNPGKNVWPDPKFLYRGGVEYEFKMSVCTNDPCVCQREEEERERKRRLAGG